MSRKAKPKHEAPLRSADSRPGVDAGTHAHYSDPRYYSDTYAQRDDDVVYYTQVALEHGGPVLEYGCGNGRIALPIARGGVHVTGIDVSKVMLDDFRKRLRAEPQTVRPRITIKRGDMRSVRLSKRYPLVLCTFNTFLHLYTRQDVERYLARVKQHLARGGLFVLDVSIPDVGDLAREPGKPYRTPRFLHKSSGQVVRYAERFDYDDIDQVLVVDMEFEPVDCPDAAWVTPLAHRQFFPQELEALLHYNGFRVATAHGDFLRWPPDRDSETLILHCRRRR